MLGFLPRFALWLPETNLGLASPLDCSILLSPLDYIMLVSIDYFLAFDLWEGSVSTKIVLLRLVNPSNSPPGLMLF